MITSLIDVFPFRDQYHKPYVYFIRYNSTLNDGLSSKYNISFSLFSVLLVMLVIAGCTKEKAHENDPRLKYVGQWNFKSTSYYFSGYYDYSGQTPVWTYTESTTIGYNDSTGFVKIGENENELLVQFCNTCETRVYNLTQNNSNDWTVTDSTFYHNIQPAPPGYTSAYSTYKVDGWKIQ